MQQNENPRKRPLLTPEQLRIMHREPERIKKGTPREEFEKLFRPPAAANELTDAGRTPRVARFPGC